MKRKNRKWNITRVLLLTLFLGGIVLLMVPPVTLYKGEQENRELIEDVKEASPEKQGDTDGGILGYLTIERLGIEYAVVEGTDRNALAYHIGHMTGTADMGMPGNCVLAGHRGGRFGLFFLHLDRIVKGDTVKLTDTAGKEYIYEAEKIFVTDAFDNTIKIQGEEKELTLLTCTEKGTKRLIVKCGYKQ